MDITNIIEALISLIFALLSAFVIPWIKRKIDASELAELADYVVIGVRAAEQMFRASGLGEKKKEYVLNFLRGLGYTVNDEVIDNLIEASVLELKLDTADYI